jgi:succinyl-diaminopimelate desuccinylase
MNTERKEAIQAYVEHVWPQVLEDIATLVAINSVDDSAHATPGKPYGEGPAAAMEAALAIAERLGLTPHNAEGRIAFADLPGESDTQLATIAHVDIVPVGTGWDTDPFELVVRDGYLLGRGVLDDKGPLVLTFWAAHYFAQQVEESGKRLPYTLRCIIGGNEETDLTDVEYYNEHFAQPAFLFTPDAEYPVCCGEKGGFSATLRTGAIAGGRIVEFDGGTVGNAIPSLATVTVRAEASSLPAAPGIEIAAVGEGLARLTAHGIGGHASKPEGTQNAIGMLVSYLWEHHLYSESEQAFLELERLVFGSTDGSTLGIAATDDVFEPLTCIGGTMRTVDGHFEQTIDSRFPKSITAEQIEATVGALAAKYGCTLTVDLALPPFFIDPSAPEIQACIDTFNSWFGRHDKPFTIGGGTYAREFKKAASFGPEMPGLAQPAWVGQMHGPNEGMSEQLLKDSLGIYIEAISRLMELPLEASTC